MNYEYEMKIARTQFAAEQSLYKETQRIIDELESQKSELESVTDKIQKLSFELGKLARQSQSQTNTQSLNYAAKFWLKFSVMVNRLMQTNNLRKVRQRLEEPKFQPPERRQTSVKNSSVKKSPDLYVAQLYQINLDDE